MISKILPLIIVCLILFSCDTKDYKLRDAGESREIIAEMAPPIRQFAAPVAVDKISVDKEEAVPGIESSGPDPIKNNTIPGTKKIIKDGRIFIKTNDIASSKKGIDEIVKKFNSYYDTEELRNDVSTTSYELKLRIPAENFEKVIQFIESGKDEIVSKSIHSRDITEEYVDIEARLNYKRDFLKRYKDLLVKASTVKDILAVEDNIRKLQEEIESKEGRLKYLNDQISYSTLEIELTQEKEYVYKPKPLDKFSERLKNSLSRGWSSLVSFILWLAGIWPFLIILYSIFLIYNKIIRKRRNRNSDQHSKKKSDG